MTVNVRSIIHLAGSLFSLYKRPMIKRGFGLTILFLHVCCTSGKRGWINKHIWLIRTLYLSLASRAHVSVPVVAPADAVKEDVNELLSHVGCCLWGSSQDSLHVLSLFAVWKLWCAAWLQRVACGQTGGDQLSTGGPCCGPTLSPAEQRLDCVCKCVCVFLSLYVCASLSEMHACLFAGAFVSRKHMWMHIQTLETLWCPVDSYSD